MGILKEKYALSSAGCELGGHRQRATADVLLEKENNTGVTESRAGARPGPLSGSRPEAGPTSGFVSPVTSYIGLVFY